MRERSELVEEIRGELVGPARWLKPPTVIKFQDGEFVDSIAFRRGPLAWHPEQNGPAEEILYYERESPHRKYGAGLLHPQGIKTTTSVQPDDIALQATDTIGAE